MQDSETWVAVTGNSRERRAWSVPTPAARRALALGAGFVAAKCAVVLFLVAAGGGRTLADVASPLALIYEDVILVAVLFGLDALTQRATSPGQERARWLVVWALVAYSAFNVAVARVFATPLTVSMLGAAGGALSDSIFAYVTPGNVAAIAVVLGLAVGVSRFEFGTIPPRSLTLPGVLFAASLLLGPRAAARVETLGLHRNAAVTLVSTWLARVAPPPRVAGRVAELPAEGRALDLTHLAGALRGRNVVWVILESTAAQYLTSYGAKLDVTPNLTRLAENALVFEHAYSAYPESIKGLFSMLCARYPAAGTTAADYVAARVPCAPISDSFRRAGYRTGFFHSGRFRYLGMQGIVDDRGFDELHDAETIGGKYSVSFGTDDASTVRRLLEFVDGSQGRRFFAVYSPISGHHPYKAPGNGPRPFREKTEKDRYQNDLYSGDAAFGELVRGLGDRSLLENTAFVIVGDHGEAFDQHEGNFAHTLHLYEENVHVPLIVAAPGLTLGSVRVPQVASLTDLAPTTLALLGLPRQDLHAGRSLLEPEPGVARFYTDQGPLKLGLRQGRYKLIHETEHDRSRLFDLQRDPGEKHDIAAEEPERTARYRKHVLDWSNAERALISRR